MCNIDESGAGPGTGCGSKRPEYSSTLLLFPDAITWLYTVILLPRALVPT